MHGGGICHGQERDCCGEGLYCGGKGRKEWTGGDDAGRAASVGRGAVICAHKYVNLQ